LPRAAGESAIAPPQVDNSNAQAMVMRNMALLWL
jgi:hypothetical protein